MFILNKARAPPVPALIDPLSSPLLPSIGYTLSGVLAAIDDRIHNLELGTNAMQTLLRELGNLFWPDYYCYHKEEIGTRLMKLFLSRWSGLDLLMEELFADAQSHNSLIQKVPQDLSFQYYQTVLPEQVCFKNRLCIIKILKVRDTARAHMADDGEDDEEDNDDEEDEGDDDEEDDDDEEL
uniref:Uncharacterized protein n=1 Tax=Bionectria ochroleuca TaxID=29856 RepID=A0A0B7KEP1_BIOOC